MFPENPENPENIRKLKQIEKILLIYETNFIRRVRAFQRYEIFALHLRSRRLSVRVRHLAAAAAATAAAAVAVAVAGCWDGRQPAVAAVATE